MSLARKESSSGTLPESRECNSFIELIKRTEDMMCRLKTLFLSICCYALHFCHPSQKVGGASANRNFPFNIFTCRLDAVCCVVV